jgi:hypothetical protein
LAEVDQLVGNFVFGEVMLGRHNVLEQSLFDRTPAQLIWNLHWSIAEQTSPDFVTALVRASANCADRDPWKVLATDREHCKW